MPLQSSPQRLFMGFSNSITSCKILLKSTKSSEIVNLTISALFSLTISLSLVSKIFYVVFICFSFSLKHLSHENLVSQKTLPYKR